MADEEKYTDKEREEYAEYIKQHRDEYSKAAEITEARQKRLELEFILENSSADILAYKIPEGLQAKDYVRLDMRLNKFKKKPTQDNACFLQIELSSFEWELDESLHNKITGVRKKLDEVLADICKIFISNKCADETEEKRLKKKNDLLLGNIPDKYKEIYALRKEGKKTASAVRIVGKKLGIADEKELKRLRDRYVAWMKDHPQFKV